MTIWKYEIGTNDMREIEMPRGAKILTVQTQQGSPCIWALVDPNAPTETRLIETYGTGHPIDEKERRYIGTYQTYNGALIFHVVELIHGGTE